MASSPTLVNPAKGREPAAGNAADVTAQPSNAFSAADRAERQMAGDHKGQRLGQAAGRIGHEDFF